jgi:hypothetical protein
MKTVIKRTNKKAFEKCPHKLFFWQPPFSYGHTSDETRDWALANPEKGLPPPKTPIIGRF